MNDVAARATMRLGDVKRVQGHFDEATKRYEEVLQVKEWKGELWPQALYFVGESLREQGKEKEAYAYYQRIYVLYPHYKEWTAKAYLRCADISVNLGLKDDAVKTLGEISRTNRCVRRPNTPPQSKDSRNCSSHEEITCRLFLVGRRECLKRPDTCSDTSRSAPFWVSRHDHG